MSILCSLLQRKVPNADDEKLPRITEPKHFPKTAKQTSVNCIPTSCSTNQSLGQNQAASPTATANPTAFPFGLKPNCKTKPTAETKLRRRKPRREAEKRSQLPKPNCVEE